MPRRRGTATGPARAGEITLPSEACLGSLSSVQAGMGGEMTLLIEALASDLADERSLHRSRACAITLGRDRHGLATKI